MRVSFSLFVGYLLYIILFTEHWVKYIDIFIEGQLWSFPITSGFFSFTIHPKMRHIIITINIKPNRNTETFKTSNNDITHTRLLCTFGLLMVNILIERAYIEECFPIGFDRIYLRTSFWYSNTFKIGHFIYYIIIFYCDERRLWKKIIPDTYNIHFKTVKKTLCCIIPRRISTTRS